MAHITQFQNDVRQLLATQAHIKQLKAQVKVASENARQTSDRIVKYMETGNIYSCRAGDLCFTIEEKKKMPSLSAKKTLEKVRSHFSIDDAAMNDFVQELNQEREEACQTTKCLKQKSVSKAQKNSPPPPATLPPPSVDGEESMASTLDSIYTT